MVWSAEYVGNTQREMSAQGWGVGEGGDNGGAEVGKMSNGLPEWKGGGHLQGGVPDRTAGLGSAECAQARYVAGASGRGSR